MWRYDADGVLRVAREDLAFVAATLTWLAAQEDGRRLPTRELDRLAELPAGNPFARGLATGAPPLYLRQAALPPILAAVPARTLPVLVQVDTRAEGFGPWAVLMSVGGREAVLADPMRGRIRVAVDDLEDHLAGVVALYRDPEGITGLRLDDTGDGVRALQARLSAAGAYEGEATGHFDEATDRALARFRLARGIPMAEGVDAAAAMALLAEPMR